MGGLHGPSGSPNDESEFLGEEFGTIQLSGKNFTKGFVGNKQQLLLLFDSGASKSIISQSCISRSTYLSQLPQFSTKERRFRVGNGEYLVSNKRIVFSVNVQGCILQIDACIVNNLAGPDVLIGDSSLKALRSSINFANHVVTVRPRKVWLLPLTFAYVKPGITRYIAVRCKIPKVLANSEILVQTSANMAKYMPSSMLVKLHRGICHVPVTNKSNKGLRVHSNKPIAFTDLNRLTHVSNSIDEGTVHTFVSREECESDTQFEVLSKYPHLTGTEPMSKLSEREVLKMISLDTEDCVLNEDSKSRVRDMLYEHKNAFSLYGEIGHCPNIEIDLELKDEKPFSIRPYNLPEPLKPVMDKEISKLVKLGILKKGCSAYSSPCMLIKKPHSDEYRFVSDFRHLNKRIVTAQQNYMSLQQVLAKLGRYNSSVLSIIDLKSAFHTLQLSEHSQKYTGICPYPGALMYQYQRLPMGLNVSPALWQQKMNEILATIPDVEQFCVAIHDDCIIFSRSEEEHMNHLRSILQAFEHNGLKLSPQKCRLFRNRCTYIGHDIQISPDGIVQVKAMSDKCDAIRKMLKPTSPREVRRFIGTVTYLSMYLPRLQTLLQPLHNLTRRNKPFIWTDEHDVAFDAIKSLLVTPPVLCAPQGNGKFHLYSDTSRTGTGSVLMQEIDGDQRVIGYYSKLLPKAALRYSVTELELTGLVINITAWKYYLQACSFHCYVDHSSLIQIYNSKTQPPTLRLQKLIERLSRYSFDLSYQKGKDMVVSDFLSRTSRDDDDDLERIMPLAMPILLNDAYPVDCAFPATKAIVERPVTRAYAKKNQISIKPIFSTKSSKSNVGRSDKSSSTNTVSSTNQKSSSTPTKSGDTVQTSLGTSTRSQGSVNPTPMTIPLSLDIGNNNSNPQHIPQPEEPRLVDRVGSHSSELNEDLSSCEIPEYLKQPKPLVTNADEIVAHHIPKQGDLNKVLSIIQRKIIRDYNLPFHAQQFRLAQTASPHFKPIYDWLAHNILPSDKKSARSIMLRAEQFILCGGFLFRLLFPSGQDHFCLQLVIPEKYIDSLISKYHDSLLSNHQGCVRTYLTMRKLFYFPNMYQRIVSYVQSCARCQQFKGNPNILRPFHERIPLSYCPFQTVSLDFKKMVTSRSGYSWLMVTTCAITRYTVCVPLKTLDAPSICEALIQRVICCYGIPEILVTDAQSSLIGKVMEILCKTLNISHKVISVLNHGSLHVERQIRSISDLIKVNLDQYGDDWVRYYSVAQYSFNTFSSPQLGNHSPFYLVFYREPRDFSGLTFHPPTGLSSSQKDYIQQLNERFQSVSKFMIDLQEHQQKAQNEKISQKLNKSPVYEPGQLVYLHKPDSSSLTANSKKFTAKYVGPFVVYQVLDSTHVLLADIKGRVLRDVFHINRIKPAFIRAPDSTNITHLQKLRNALAVKQDTNVCTDQAHITTCNEPKSVVVDEHGTKLEYNESEFCFTAQTNPVDLTHHELNMTANNGLACPTALSLEQQVKLLEKLQTSPMSEAVYTIVRARFRLGSLQLLLAMSSPKGEIRFWWNPNGEENYQNLVTQILDTKKIKCTGTPEKFVGNLYSMLRV